ncbi:MAG: hypothetical protein ACOY81_04385 [Bacillota bacterium]|uniref:hypothetical protein n=1 Tax=Desulfurispora thermophila TaxID=265470 RepID=UPI000362419B|nr:hypothetical protein [Desulfurispora thermophila]
MEYQESIGRLAAEIEKIQQESKRNNEHNKKLLAALERLTADIELLAQKKEQEKELMDKLNQVSAALGSLLENEQSSPPISWEENLSRITRQIALVGQIISLVAGSVQMALDAKNKNQQGVE